MQNSLFVHIFASLETTTLMAQYEATKNKYIIKYFKALLYEDD